VPFNCTTVPEETVWSDPALAIGLGGTAIPTLTASGALETPMLFMTTKLKTKSMPVAEIGAMKVGDDDVKLLRETDGPDVWVQL
jgi:hypothetical protein